MAHLLFSRLAFHLGLAWVRALALGSVLALGAVLAQCGPEIISPWADSSSEASKVFSCFMRATWLQVQNQCLTSLAILANQLKLYYVAENAI